MFGRFIYDFIFLGMPAILLILLIISTKLYVSAKKKNKETPGTFTDKQIKVRKIFLIVLSVIVGTIVTIILGIMILLCFAVANM